MKKILSISILVLSSYCNCFSQTINWEKSYGGTSNDNGHSIIRLNNEYWTVSSSTSLDYDVLNNHGSNDAWITCIDSLGMLLKSKCFGGTYTDNGQKIISTFDNCLVIAGYGSYNDGDLTGSTWHGDKDFWVFKIDTAMNLIWSRCIGGGLEDIANSIVQTSDSGFLVVGNSKSIGSDVPGHHGSSITSDIFLTKVDKNGIFQWGKNYGGDWDDDGIDIVQTNDGGSLLLSYSNSINGDLAFSHLGQIAIFKLDSIGGIEWVKAYGGSNSETAYELLLNSDGSFYVASATKSDDGQVTNHIALIDSWLLKIDPTGNLIWQSCIGSGGLEEAITICKTVSGNLMVGFYDYMGDSIFDTYSNIGPDIFMALLDTNGNYISGNNFGGSLTDNVYDVIPIAYNRNLIIGETKSYDYDVSYLHSINYYDTWIAEISDGGTSSINAPDKTLKDIHASVNNYQFNLNFFCKKKQELKLNIYDISGRLIFNKNAAVNNGLNNFNFPIVISTGTYILSITGNEGTKTQLKIIAINN